MTQTISRTVNLGAANTGLALGYRVLNLDRTTFGAFTTTDVVETTVLGTYSIDNGFVAPDAGGYIIWGTAGVDRVEGDITPASPTALFVADSVWDEARADHVAAGSFGQGVASVQGNVTGSAASVTGAVGSVTGNVGGNVVGSVASVAGNVGGNVVGSVDSVVDPVTVGTNNDKIGYSLSAAGIQAVWDALTGALTTVGSIGKLLVDNVNATISSRSSHTAADVWTNGTRTLTSFGTLVADIATAVWSAAVRTLTSTAAQVADAVSGSELTITRAVTFSASLSGMTIPSTWTAVYFTAKNDLDDDDAEAVIQIRKSNPGVGSDGLLYLNEAAGTAAQASLTVNQAGGSVTISIADDATAQLAIAQTLEYDLKVLTSAGESNQLTASALYVQGTATRTI